MPWKSKEKRNEYQRELMRERRSSSKLSTEETLERKHYKLRSADQLLDIAEDIINEVNASQMDLAVKARSIATLLNSAIKLVESSTQEARISAIEDRLNNAVTEVSEP